MEIYRDSHGAQMLMSANENRRTATADGNSGLMCSAGTFLQAEGDCNTVAGACF